jgi:tetratricopeptide (TPR) repeat protein
VDQQQFARGIADFNAAIRLNPRSRDAYILRAEAQFRKRDLKQAAADLRKALEIDPASLNALNDMGYVAMDQGHYDEAIEHFSKAFRIDPKDVAAIQNRGWAWHKKADDRKALADYQEAARIDGAYPPTYLHRAISFAALGEYDKALADYKRVFELRKDESADCNCYAWFLATCPDAHYRDGQRAIELAKKACELSQWKVGWYVDTLAAAHAENGDFAEAVRWQKKALELGVAAASEKKEMTDRMSLYDAHKPYRELPKAAAATEVKKK